MDQPRRGGSADFNSRPPRGRTSRTFRQYFNRYFNSRPREGANLPRRNWLPWRQRFQFPPPRGGELRSGLVYVKPHYFNSRPREGANRAAPRTGWPLHYFNSRPREGANVRYGAGRYHLPAISIPAPARGRTPRTPGVYSRRFHFNSRPREGANGQVNARLAGREDISIPAPARGRTEPLRTFAASSTYFNSRPREGANFTPAESFGALAISIPAPARGRTRFAAWWHSRLRFQFPPPRGGERMCFPTAPTL